MALGIGTAMISTITKKPKEMLSLLQYKGIVPTINQFKLVYALTIMSRLVAARDKNEHLYAHEVNPKKYKQYGLWVGEDAIGLHKFNVDFPMVKYADDVAWKISDLKELKIVENY